LYGTLLGDGWVDREGLFRTKHAVAQRDYLEIKAKIFGALVSPKGVKQYTDTSGGCVRDKCEFYTAAASFFHDARDLCYIDGVKKVTQPWLDRVGQIGLAFWYFDDGCLVPDGQIMLCTEGFDKDSVDLLVRWLTNQWQITAVLDRNNSKYGDRPIGWRIRITQNNTPRFLELVAPYAPECMWYKLGLDREPRKCVDCRRPVDPAEKRCDPCTAKVIQAYGTRTLPSHFHMRRGGSVACREWAANATYRVPNGVVSTQRRIETAGTLLPGIIAGVPSLQPAVLARVGVIYEENRGRRWEKCQTAYDIEVEGTHNYFANGFLVSNSTWGRISLHEPMLNPVFEEPARKLLGLTENEFRDTIAGKYTLPGGVTGMSGIIDKLKHYDVKKELDSARRVSAGSRKTARDAANKKIGYLKYMDKNGSKPDDWIWHAVPVLPPAYRPVTPGRAGQAAVSSDVNLVYKDLIEANNGIKSIANHIDDVGPERLNLYDAVKAVTGLGEPVTAKNRERGVKGILGKLLGDTGKHSFVQTKLLGTSVDLSGRGQVLPSPDLDMDEIGIPESIAWDIYHPFVVRRMVRNGVPRVEAAIHARDRTDTARKALTDEMDVRPVRATRYPVLHRYGSFGFRPRLVSGSAILSNNLVNKPLGLDHDGNCVAFETEVSLEIDEVARYSSPVWSTQAEETVMRLYGKSLVEMMFDGSGAASVIIPIGEFPRTGEGVLDKNGARIFSVPDGVRVLTAVPGRGAFYADVTAFTVEDNCQTVTVRTADDYEVIVSDNESLAVFDPETAAIKKEFPAEAKNKWVPVIRKAPIVGTRFSSEFGWWYGAFLSDGWLSDRYVGYAKLSTVHRDTFVEYARRHITENFTVNTYTESAAGRTDKHADSCKIHCTGELRHRLLDCYSDRTDPEARGALYKRVPEEILTQGSEACLFGVLAGMLEGDGTLTWNTTLAKKRAVIRITTSSPTLVATTKRLLRRLGIRSSTTETAPRVGANTHIAYVVNPSVIDIHAVIRRLPFITDKAKQFATDFAASPIGADRTDVIPLVTSLLEEYGRILCAAHEMNLYGGVRTALKSSGRIARTLCRRVLEKVEELRGVELHPLHGAYSRIVNDTGVGWDQIKTVIDAGRRQVFDFEVPDGKLFAVNDGLVIYDTFTVNVPLTDDAVKETYEKLLPSKNLFTPSTMKSHLHPNMEYLQGLHSASVMDEKNPPVVFKTLADAKAAYARGDINLGTRIHVTE
jgi:intein/homing endonuclease